MQQHLSSPQEDTDFSTQLQKRDAEIERLKQRMRDLVHKLTSKNGKVSDKRDLHYL